MAKIRWTLAVFGNKAVLTLCRQATEPRPGSVAEFLLAFRHTFLVRYGPPGWRLRFVAFRHLAPADVTQFEEVFGVAPRFGAAENQIGFDASLLEAPMRRRDAALAELFARYAEQRRDLEMAGEVRRIEAEQRLLRGEPMSQIAYALGFNDVPAFHHAFQRWTGATPGEFRARGPSPSDLRCSPSSSSTCARRTSRSACGGSRIFSFLVGNGGVAPLESPKAVAGARRG
jgi:AraC-like DNA-binding protein